MSFQALALVNKSSALVAAQAPVKKPDPVAQAKVINARPVETKTVQPATPATPAQTAMPVQPKPTVQSSQADVDSAMSELERLRAENAAMKAQIARASNMSKMGISLKVSEKGALSLYGLGKFPTTLYAEQWLKVLSMSEVIVDFINTNRAALKDKEPPAEATAKK